ncbi:MAG TPA: class I adenylate-forming enzyme family protein [Luteibacter sp.]|jgi:acyl-CoA synthetase (AMP-forming)/AMP-acid ligase II|nr:class I adenylate-forming enzyme family protein [Luteibacter sp.]
MKSQTSALLSRSGQDILKADTTLGSGNFLDRCLAVNPARDVPFLFLDAPVTLPCGQSYRSFSLQTLDLARRSLACWYINLGVKRNDIVAVMVAEGITPFLHHLALTSMGATGSLMNPAMPIDAATAYVLKHGFVRLVIDDTLSAAVELAARLEEAYAPCEIAACPRGGEPRGEFMPSSWPVEPADSTLVLLSHTSGTTGIPKAVRHEHRQFFMRKRVRIGQFMEYPDDRLLTALPQSHSAGISHLEIAVLHGIPTLILSDLLGEPVRAALRDFAPSIVLGFPQTYTSLVEAGIAPNEFPSVRRWFSMGDAAHESHVRKVLDGSDDSRFMDLYGNSELGMVLAKEVSREKNLRSRRLIGRPVEISLAKVLHPDTGQEMAEGGIGLIAILSPTSTTGYWQQPELTALSWRNGYFLTGDIGYAEHGNFYQVDRVADVISLPGTSLYSLLLEEELQQIPAVHDVSVVGILPDRRTGQSHAIFALVVPERDSPERDEVIAAEAWSALGNAMEQAGIDTTGTPVFVAVTRDISGIPVGATGKVLKRKLRESFSAYIATSPDSRENFYGIRYITSGTSTDDYPERIRA